MQEQEKPRTLVCYICGREFGTTSLAIHLKSCTKKFEIAQQKKQAKDRRKMPKAPQELQQILNGNLSVDFVEIYNKKATNTHKYEVLPKCKYCDRTFNQQSLKAHENGCSKKGNQKTEEKWATQFSDNLKKPRTLTCCICGREFGLTSLKIHYPQCLQKFNNDEKVKPKGERRQPPMFTDDQLKMINTKQDWAIEEIEEFNKKASDDYKQKAMFGCENCGRKFFQSAYHKHKKNCVLINGAKNASTEKSKNLSVPKSIKSEDLRATTSEFKKPRTLTCCVCGRDFGLTSLKIHYPQCLQKFITQQEKKPKAERKVPPKFSQEKLQMINNKSDWTMEDIEDFNNHANTHYREKALIKCENCGRKFIQQSYPKHKKNCVLINGDKQSKKSLNKSVDNMRPSTPSQYSKPRTLTCCICGRDFGLTSLKIHYPQCLQKFKADQSKKVKSERKSAPQFSEEQLEMVNNKQNWSLLQVQQFNAKANEIYRNKAMVQCQNCGRKFIEQSYAKHRKNCELLNGKNRNSSCTKNSSEKDNSSTEPKKPRVLMCHICGREFGLSSLNIHVPQCQQKFLNAEKKKEKDQRRPVPKFPEQQKMKFDLSGADGWKGATIQQYNKIANQVYREQSLCPCPYCGRKFFQESLPKHVKFCQKNSEPDSENRSGSFSSQKRNKAKQPSLRKTISTNSSKLGEELYEKIQQISDQQLESTPQREKEESFLRKSMYKKIQQSPKEFNPGLGIQKIVQADERMQETMKNCEKKSEEKIHSNSIIQEIKKQVQNKCSQEQNTNHQEKLDKAGKDQNKQEAFMEYKFKQLGKEQFKETENQQLTEAAKQVISNTQSGENQVSDPSQFVDEKRQALTEQSDERGKQLFSTITKQKQKSQMRTSKGFAAPRKKQEVQLAKMKDCKICNHKFDEDRIQKHQKLCLASKQRKKKSEASLNKSILGKIGGIETDQKSQRLESSQKNERQLLTPKQKVRLNKGFAAPREKQIEAQAKMVECKGCKRKFTDDRIQKHQNVCKKAQQVRQQNNGAEKKQQKEEKVFEQEKVSIKRVACPKCNRKFIEERLDKHVQICKAGLPLMAQTQSSLNKISSKFQKPAQLKVEDLEKQDLPIENINIEMRQCQKCNRKFNAQRIDKHHEVCKGKKKDAELERVPNKNGEKKIKEAKDKIPSKAYNLEQIQVKNEDEQDERVQCHKCLRKFASDRLQKHINICKAVPPLSNAHLKGKTPAKKLEEIDINENILSKKVSLQTSPKDIQSIGDDQYVQEQLIKCEKCSRKFVADRLNKHRQICKGTQRVSNHNLKQQEQRRGQMSRPKQQEIRKTKNQFFNMVKQIKTKKVREEEIQKQIQIQLHEIQLTNKISKKQNENRGKSEKKSPKDFNNQNRSINLPKI